MTSRGCSLLRRAKPECTEPAPGGCRPKWPNFADARRSSSAGVAGGLGVILLKRPTGWNLLPFRSSGPARSYTTFSTQKSVTARYVP